MCGCMYSSEPRVNMSGGKSQVYGGQACLVSNPWEKVSGTT